MTPDVINVGVRIPKNGDIYTNMSYICLMGCFNYDGTIVKLPVQITWMIHETHNNNNIDLQGIYDIKGIDKLTEYKSRWLIITEDANYSTGSIITESNIINNSMVNILRTYFKIRA